MVTEESVGADLIVASLHIISVIFIHGGWVLTSVWWELLDLEWRGVGEIFHVVLTITERITSGWQPESGVIPPCEVLDFIHVCNNIAQLPEPKGRQIQGVRDRN